MEIEKYVINTILVLAFGLAFGINCMKSEREIESIVIQKVDFNLSTFWSVGCSEFNARFADIIKVDTVHSSEVDQETRDHIVKVLRMDSKDKLEPDVRSKLYINYKNHRADTACISLHGGKIKSEYFKPDSLFIQFIKDN